LGPPKRPLPVAKKRRVPANPVKKKKKKKKKTDAKKGHTP